MVHSGNTARYGFVVLHFNNHLDTIACVNSIFGKIRREDYHVVIVDNASSNNSFDLLTQEYSGRQRISLVRNDENRGYSGGNNVGIRTLREMGVSQIIIATNDTEVLSPNLLDEFDKIESSDVGIVGTDILTPEGIHQNPQYHRPTLSYLLNLHFYAPWIWMRGKVYKWIPIIERMRRISIAHSIKELGDGPALAGAHLVYMLHGSFLYLTRNYINQIGLLDENLFMYGEEDLMSWNCEKHGLKRMYLPSLKVLHKDGRSTKDAHQERKEEFVRKMTLGSKRYLAQQIPQWALLRVVLAGWLK